MFNEEQLEIIQEWITEQIAETGIYLDQMDDEQKLDFVNEFPIDMEFFQYEFETPREVKEELLALINYVIEQEA
ncbi:hypothetical protein [[Acholeplasma] multilocale]|uniref:hypothetical protein n=1 Tax=[Acholeplasma] multilocale TaxID=264638 RepID=UPI00047A0716|nr:hypothetical protein [[Acholeplasma] multilocale]